ncbi:ubiquitin-conjugating enzyme e2 [Tupanvirus deep ocean]|uniref:Ubiquitin-conjugating enzyme e2 n=2 Tax=Tupanvirus TaxID=2094720 RepID=A0AC62A779_9VIRU|nr:ubiquitin-conjugating enzyme e2 [Tupanvirus deep ocean]QKU33555.1 ubiquitin-conjugating enzyme e2 [Tupanvirus deep ocean]
MPDSKITKKEQNRKSPSVSATSYDVGTRMRGNDGRFWEIASYNGIKRWVPIQVGNGNSGSKSMRIRHRNSRSQNQQNIRQDNQQNDRPSKRKGPIQSATNYPVGTKKWGLDGKQWIVLESSNGVRRWSPYSLDTSAIRYKNDTVTYFDVDKIIPKLKLGRMVKIGELDVTSNRIGVGELLFHEYPTAKGRYIIYHYAGSLIAVHENESLKGQKFDITKGSANCDIGMFAFNDAGYIKKYINEKKSNITSFFGISFPDFDTGIFITRDRKVLDYAYVYDSDLEINKGNTDADDNNPIAIFATNNFGDGSFPIYQGRNAFWIMSQDVQDRMLELINK